MKTLKLGYSERKEPSDRHNERPLVPTYEVIEVRNSVLYHPGQILKKEEVRDLCEMTGMWTISIVKGEKETITIVKGERQ
jgi:hypothetical protein